MNALFTFRGFAYDPQSILATVQRLALVSVELLLDGRLGIPHVGVSRELGVATFTDSHHRNIPASLYDPKIAFRHIQSLAHREGRA